jgi:TatD DNase family protein
MKIFDTHCHYNLEPLYSGKSKYFSPQQMRQLKNLTWKDHWQKAQQSGVSASLVAAADVISSQRAVKIAQEENSLYASVGIHPSNANKNSQALKNDFDVITKLASKKEVVGIGETGLDYFHLSKPNLKRKIVAQKELFIKHINLANTLEKPLIIHSRDKGDQAYDDLLKIIRANYQFKKPLVLHCVSGTVTHLKKMLKLNAYVSFAGNITYTSGNLHNLIKLVPQDKLLIETDAPFLPPQEFIGQINQPYMITKTAQYIQDKFNKNLKQILANSYKFFEI